MKLTDLPHFQIFKNKKVKVLRHKDSKIELWNLYASGKFERYQNGQSWDVFGDAEYIISFIAERNKYAKFAGVWEVKSKRGKANGVQYQTKEIKGFDDFKTRLIVNWGEGTRSWAQLLERQGDKEIVEILPPNYVLDFPGFYNFALTFDQLFEIVTNPDSNREWQRMLVSVSGVYVILDKKSGLQYIGSAYGFGGIWNRWKNYSKTFSGGNKLLEELLKKYPTRYKQFQFSILRVLEPSSTKNEVLEQETLLKIKLGSRAFGLNSN